MAVCEIRTSHIYYAKTLIAIVYHMLLIYSVSPVSKCYFDITSIDSNKRNGSINRGFFVNAEYNSIYDIKNSISDQIMIVNETSFSLGNWINFMV